MILSTSFDFYTDLQSSPDVQLRCIPHELLIRWKIRSQSQKNFKVVYWKKIKSTVIPKLDRWKSWNTQLHSSGNVFTVICSSG